MSTLYKKEEFTIDNLVFQNAFRTPFSFWFSQPMLGFLPLSPPKTSKPPKPPSSQPPTPNPNPQPPTPNPQFPTPNPQPPNQPLTHPPSHPPPTPRGSPTSGAELRGTNPRAGAGARSLGLAGGSQVPAPRGAGGPKAEGSPRSEGGRFFHGGDGLLKKGHQFLARVCELCALLQGTSKSGNRSFQWTPFSLLEPKWQSFQWTPPVNRSTADLRRISLAPKRLAGLGCVRSGFPLERYVQRFHGRSLLSPAAEERHLAFRGFSRRSREGHRFGQRRPMVSLCWGVSRITMPGQRFSSM